MRDVLLVIDALDDFAHADGDRLLASFRARAQAMRETLEAGRTAGVPVVYANDNRGAWDGDRNRLVREALDGPGGALVPPLVPQPRDQFVIKPRYSAFDLTPLEMLLAGLGAERLVMIGSTTEMCVAQTAIDARERRLMVSVVTDACACIDAAMERVALAYLEGVVGVRLGRAPFFGTDS